MLAPIKIEVYTKDFRHVGNIGAPKFATVVPRYNAVGTATVGVFSSDRLVGRCMDNGARLWIKDSDGEHLMSGRIVRDRGTGPAMQGLIEFDIEDDFAVIGETLGWVQPAQPITDQGIAGDNWVLNGPAETVLKTAMQVNAVDRLGNPITIAATQGRGTPVTAKLRFHPIYDRLFPVVDGAGIDAAGVGFFVRQQGQGLLLDAYEPSTYPRELTESSGVITDWKWSRSRATVSDVVVGGQGEAQLRAYRDYIDTQRRADLGRAIERFRDARDVDDVIDLPVRGQATLDDGGPKNGLSVTLSQTKNFRYGKSVRVGDMMTMRVGPDITITDRLTEATLSWTRDNGWSATPKVGERTDDPNTLLAKTVVRLARAFSHQNRT